MTDQLLTVRSAEMYLIALACQALLATIISAKSFHKYPYVFLLDIGNEELQKTNTEQIRLSLPGGSIALRYPAIGDGDTIAHVRVSGIDFGTDLKANIVDGGPGSKYVIIVFAGKRGMPYDAVLTLQTVSDEDMKCYDDGGKNCSTVEDSNDSAEDTSDISTETKVKNVKELDSQGAGNTNAEIRRPNNYAVSIDESEVENNEDIHELKNKLSSSAYSSKKDNTDEDYDNTNEDEIMSNNKEIHGQNSESNGETENDDELEEYDSDSQKDKEADSDGNDRDSEPSQVNSETSDFSDDYENEDNDEAENTDNISKLPKYQPLIPKLYGGLKIYPQNAVPLVKSDGDNSVYNSEDPNEVDQTFNDEELHNISVKNKVTKNNNYFVDSDDSSAVES